MHWLKKHLGTFILLTVIVGVFATPISFSVSPDNGLEATPNVVQADWCGSLFSIGSPLYGFCKSTTLGAKAAGGQVREAAQKEAANVATVTFNTIVRLASILVLEIVSWILWMSGIFLNMVVQVTVADMSTFVNQFDVIDNVWTQVRDVANIGFVFVLMYISFALILDLQTINTKKLLRNVIIAALLINFSLFFTKALTDISNLAALQFHEQIQEIGADSCPDGAADGCLSEIFVDSFQMTAVYTPTGDADVANLIGDSQSAASRMLLGSFFMITAAIIFFIVGFLFVIRFVTLLILMILSPLAFVGMILPQLHGISKKWWDKLADQIIFAPLFFFMLFLLVQFVTSGVFEDSSLPEGNSLMAAVAGSAKDQVNLWLNFTVITVFLFATIIISKGYSGKAGAKVTAMGARAGKGMARRAGGAIGRGAVRGSGMRRLDERFENSRFGQTAIGSSVRNITTKPLVDTKFGDKKGKSVRDTQKATGKRRDRLQNLREQKSQEKREQKAKKEYARGNIEFQQGQTQYKEATNRREKATGLSFLQQDKEVGDAVVDETRKNIEELDRLEELATTPDANMTQKMQEEFRQLRQKHNMAEVTEEKIKTQRESAQRDLQEAERKQQDLAQKIREAKRSYTQERATARQQRQVGAKRSARAEKEIESAQKAQSRLKEEFKKQVKDSGKKDNLEKIKEILKDEEDNQGKNQAQQNQNSNQQPTDNTSQQTNQEA